MVSKSLWIPKATLCCFLASTFVFFCFLCHLNELNAFILFICLLLFLFNSELLLSPIAMSPSQGTIGIHAPPASSPLYRSGQQVLEPHNVFKTDRFKLDGRAFETTEVAAYPVDQSHPGLQARLHPDRVALQVPPFFDCPISISAFA
jgi:hypothetical protein